MARESGKPEAQVGRTKSVPRADVFVSYSHKDTFWKDWFVSDRVASTTMGTVEVWADDEIRPSDDWNESIKRALETAKVAVLLVSENFLDSKFISAQELPVILDKRKKGGAKILWVPIQGAQLHLSDAGKRIGLDKIQAAWSPDKPLQGIRANESMEGLATARRKIFDEIAYALDPNGWKIRKVIESKYEVMQKLGEGASKAVFLGRDHIMKRWITITALKDGESVPEFRRSLRSASDVDDIEAFATVFDVCLDRNPPHCMRQYVEGETVEQRLNRGSFKYAYARDILCSLGRGLAIAHDRDFFHLNIKPSNVVLDMSGRPFLSPLSQRPDHFQTSKSRWRAAEDRAYAVPELYDRASPRISYGKCDQYLLGLLGYHMVTGLLPMRVSSRRRTPPTSIIDFTAQPLAPIEDLPQCRLCPNEFASALMKMASPYPDDRFETLRDAIEQLGQFKDESLSVAKDSYSRLTETSQRQHEVFNAFYAKFREQCSSPVAKARFEKLDWKKQHELLSEAILLLLVHYEFSGRESTGASVLRRVRASHAGMNIPRADYDLFRDLLVEAFVEGDPHCKTGDIVREAIRRAWAKALQPGIDYMLERT